MTQENKELLFKDLCARLPYGVVLQLPLWEEKTTDCRLTGIDEDGNLTADVPADCAFSIEGIKPYLRPMSSMTKEELREYNELYKERENNNEWDDLAQYHELIFWMISKHLDYLHWIEKGLALEAPKDMYNLNK